MTVSQDHNDGRFWLSLDRVKAWQIGSLYLRLEFSGTGFSGSRGWHLFRLPLIEVGWQSKSMR